MIYALNIGDLQVSKDAYAVYSCIGLGSCIGLFLQDRTAGISGGAHIFLPHGEQTHEENKFYAVNQAVGELLSRFAQLGSTLENLRAKMAGGASVIGTGQKIGRANSEQVIKQLVDRRIFIAARDLGGDQCRTVVFESESGVMTIRLSPNNEQRIY